MVFLEGRLDQHFPLLSDLDVCLVTVDRGHGMEEMAVHEVVPWGVGEVLGEEAGGEVVVQEALVQEVSVQEVSVQEALVQDDDVQDEVVVVF